MTWRARYSRRAKAGASKRRRARSCRPSDFRPSAPFTFPSWYPGLDPSRAGYLARNAMLRDLGFGSYLDYLASDLWARIRRSFLPRNARCAICRVRSASQVHHFDYTPQNLAGIDQHLMAPVCGACHHQIEFHDDGSKRWLHEAALASGWFQACKSTGMLVPKGSRSPN